MKGPNNSVDPYKQISIALLCDIQRLHDGSYTKSAFETDKRILCSRLAEEGIGFLTKTLPSLAKALDRALASSSPLELEGMRFPLLPNSRLPKFLGELFRMVFDDTGLILPNPSVASVRSIRQFLLVFYKLELPYDPELEQSVIQEFERTDVSLSEYNETFRCWNGLIDERNHVRRIQRDLEVSIDEVQKELDVNQALVNATNIALSNALSAWEIARFHVQVATLQNNWNRRYDGHFAAVIANWDVELCREVLSYCSTKIATLAARKSMLAGQLRWLRVLFGARKLLHQLFRTFDPMDIVPNHGPGAVSTGEQYQGKWRWTHIHDRLSAVYPIDEYFFVNMEHVADRLQSLMRIGDLESPAKVVLVPKDSRGPRLISEEPLEHQWIQQGLRRAVYQLVESHPLTRDQVRFTDQAPNANVALIASANGAYATLDLKEASDRVSLELFRLLFPANVVLAFEACRSQETKLPDGRRLKLQKFAPMGSALCFPVLALTIWSLLRAGLTDACVSRPRKGLAYKPSPDGEMAECIYVYGDDVIVRTAKAADAIAILEAFGLLVNRNKSCTGGGPSFRESCGMEAFRGQPVTPVRIRTAWTSHQHPRPYESYVEYANALHDRGYYRAHELIVELLFRLYGPLADADWRLPVPSLVSIPECYRSSKVRYHSDVAIAEQRCERRVLTVVPRKIKRPVDGWMMLLRYLTSKSEVDEESVKDSVRRDISLEIERLMGLANERPRRCGVTDLVPDMGAPFSACSYTKRRDSDLVWAWC